MPIPKKIHYVWIGDQAIPVAEQAYILGWQKLNPDFQVIKWSEKDVDYSKYPLVQKALDEKRYALASDIIRMIVLYQEGGIYLDTDMELYTSLDILTRYDAAACCEGSCWFGTAFIAAKKASPWIAAILKRYQILDANTKINTNTFLKTVHSPSVYAEKLFGFKVDGKTAFHQPANFKIYSSDYFFPKHYISGEVRLTPNTIAFHHYASTWHTPIEAIKCKLSAFSYHLLGAKNYQKLEAKFHKHLARQILRDYCPDEARNL